MREKAGRMPPVAADEGSERTQNAVVFLPVAGYYGERRLAMRNKISRTEIVAGIATNILQFNW